MTNGAFVNQNRETETDGIYACGNVLHVHDLVDFVSEEAAIAGRAAAEKILGKTAPAVHSVSVKTGFGVRYTIPERIDIPAEPTEEVRLFFRVTDIYKKVRLTITDGNGNVLVKKAKSAVAPGEMESLSLSVESLKALADAKCETITVALEEM